MSVLIVIPHRGFEAAKTRLAGKLSPEQRAALSRRMLAAVISAVRAAGGECRVVVITPDTALTEVTERAGVQLLVQHGMGLNAGLEEARATAAADVETLAVLHGDLPLLGPDDVRALLEAVPAPAGVAIGPDRAGSGTNALAMRPANAIPFRFGPRSFEAHRAAARTAGLPVAVVEREGLAFDLDTPADLDRLLALEAAS